MNKEIAYTLGGFTLMSAIFLAVSAQFLGCVFPIIFVLPIYMALNGLKKLKKSAVYIALGIIPLAISVSILWLKYFISILSNLNVEFYNISKQANVSVLLAKIITISCVILSVVMFFLAVFTFMKLLKNKKVFRY